MRNIFLGFLIGVILTLLTLNIKNIIWKDILTTTFFQSILTIGLAALAGFIALCQVKANVISSARIKWIESFKHNMSEYISQTQSALWNIELYKNNNDSKFYDKYSEALNLSALYRNKVFLELNSQNPDHINIIAKILEINKSLDKVSDNSIDKKSLALEVSHKQHELSEMVIQMLKIEWRKSKKIFQI